MLRNHPFGWLDRWFDLGDVRRINSLSDLCPCASVNNRLDLAFDSSIQDVVQRPPLNNVTTLQTCGYFESWKYVLPVQDELRRTLRWKQEITSGVRR